MERGGGGGGAVQGGSGVNGLKSTQKLGCAEQLFFLLLVKGFCHGSVVRCVVLQIPYPYSQ